MRCAARRWASSARFSKASRRVMALPANAPFSARRTSPFPTTAASSPGEFKAAFDAAKAEVALANIRERLQLHFDAEASIKTVAGDGTYEVQILMPYVTGRA